MAKNNPYVLQFNGSNSWVKIPKTLQITPSTNLTVMAIAYSSDWSSIGKKDIVCNFHSGGYGIACNDTNSGIGFVIYSGGYKNASVSLNTLTNGWHIFTGTFDGKNITFYVDGKEIVRTPQTGAISYDASTPLAIGANPNRTSVDYGYWDGLIDNVSIWNKALTQEEIQYYMNRKLDGDEESLVGYWTFDEGEGNIAHDLTSNQNHGTIYNAEWTEGEVDLKRYLPQLIDNISYNTNQKSVGDIVLISWGKSNYATRYELQYCINNEWIIINNNITNTEYAHKLTEQNPTAQYRVKGINEMGESEWVAGETFEVANQSSIDGEIIINPYNRMKGYIDIKGYGESDLGSSISIRRGNEEDLDLVLRISKKYNTDLLDGSIAVANRTYNDLNSSITLNPSGRMRGYIDIVAPVKKVKKIYPMKDSVVRQSAPTINYGNSQQMMAGKNEEGYYISYLGFDLELPDNIDVESVKLILNKQYDTSKKFFMGLYETSDDWNEEDITWDYRHWDETYITQFPIPMETGRVEADVTNYKWVEGKKSFIVRPKNYRYSDLTAFGTRESLTPPYIEVTYYEILDNAGSYSFDSSITVRGKEYSSIGATINVISDYNYSELDGLLEIEKKPFEDDIDGSITVSQLCHDHMGGEIILEKKPQETEIDFSLIVPYRTDLDSSLNIEGINKDSDLDSSISVRRENEEDLMGLLEIEQKHIDRDLDSSLIVGRTNKKYLDSSLCIELKNTNSDIDSSIIIQRPEDVDFDSSLNIDRKDCHSDIDSSIVIRRTEDSDLNLSLEVPRYNDKSEIDSSLYVKFRSGIDSSLEIPWVDSQDELDVELNIEEKPRKEDLNSSMVVRVFWVDELESSIEVVRGFEIDASLVIKRNEVDNEIDASLYVDSGGDYAFII